MITLYHNPSCSKSREAQTVLQTWCGEHGVALNIIEYLQTPPNATQLAQLHKLCGVGLQELVRCNEPEFIALALDLADKATVFAAVAANPKLLQRPIAVYKGKAAVGRPLQNILDLLPRSGSNAEV